MVIENGRSAVVFLKVDPSHGYFVEHVVLKRFALKLVRKHFQHVAVGTAEADAEHDGGFYAIGEFRRIFYSVVYARAEIAANSWLDVGIHGFAEVPAALEAKAHAEHVVVVVAVVVELVFDTGCPDHFKFA